MSTRYFFPAALAAALFCAALTAPVLTKSAPAQPAEPKPISDLPYPTLSPTEVEDLVSGDTRIALHLRDVTLESALQTLEKQSGIPLGMDRTFSPADRVELEKTLSIDLETRSFNEAFDAIIKGANANAKLTRMGNSTGEMSWTVLFNLKVPSLILVPHAVIRRSRIQVNDSNSTVRLSTKDSSLERAPQSGVGRFQIQVNDLSSTLSQTVTAGANNTFTRAQTNQLGINFQLVPDPQMPDAALPILRVSRAEDEQGRSLLAPPRPLFPGFERRNYGASYNFSDLKSLPDDTRKLAHLEGVAICTLPSAHETWEVPDLLNAAGWTHEFGSNGQTYSFTVASAKRDKETISVKLEITPSFDGQRLVGKMKLQNSDGRVFSMRELSSDGTTIEARFSLSDGATTDKTAGEPAPFAPLRLSFDVPTQWVQTAVPFSFENVPLP